MTQGTCPIIQTTSSTDDTSSGLVDGTGKQMLNLVARSTMFRNSNTCSLESASTKRSTPTPWLNSVCVWLRKQVTFWRFVLRANVALDFTRSSDRDFVLSANSQSATEQFLAREILVNTHDCQPHRIGYLFGNFCLFNMWFLGELIMRVCLHLSGPFPHLHR